MFQHGAMNWLATSSAAMLESESSQGKSPNRASLQEIPP
jgi:hypothetical protein